MLMTINSDRMKYAQYKNIIINRHLFVIVVVVFVLAATEKLTVNVPRHQVTQ